MSDDDPPHRNPLVAALMFLVGLPLLLPGVCSLLFTLSDPGNAIAGLGFFISIGGVLLIIFGVRRLVVSPQRAAVSEGVKLTLLLIALVLIIIAGVGVASLLQTPWHNR